MPKKRAKMIAFMGLSAASVALNRSWYEPSKVPYNHPRLFLRVKVVLVVLKFILRVLLKRSS